MRAWLRTLGVELSHGRLKRYRCEPAILGFNYYVTSERFLDHPSTAIRQTPWAGTVSDRYVDVEAVRVRAEGIDGAFGLLGEAWERYRRPLAITEAHLACSEAEQVRWVDEIYRDLIRLRDRARTCARSPYGRSSARGTGTRC